MSWDVSFESHRQRSGSTKSEKRKQFRALSFAISSSLYNFLFSLPLMSSAFLDTLRKHELDQVESWCMACVLHEGSIELTHGGGGVIVLFDVSLQDNMRDHRVVMLLVIVT